MKTEQIGFRTWEDRGRTRVMQCDWSKEKTEPHGRFGQQSPLSLGRSQRKSLSLVVVVIKVD